MSRKVKIVVDENADEEIIIRCKRLTNEIISLQKLAESGFSAPAQTLTLTIGDSEYFVPAADVLFFETVDGKVSVHTKDRMFKTPLRLYELLEMLPGNFMRISKSCVINTLVVSALKKSPAGICEAYFTGCEKKVFVSRMYYKPFREALSERYGK